MKGHERRKTGLWQGSPLEAGVRGGWQGSGKAFALGSGVFDMPCVIGLGFSTHFHSHQCIKMPLGSEQMPI